VERGDSILFGQEESNNQVLEYFHVFEELYVRRTKMLFANFSSLGTIILVILLSFT
jgi:hypothetical protein